MEKAIRQESVEQQLFRAEREQIWEWLVAKGTKSQKVSHITMRTLQLKNRANRSMSNFNFSMTELKGERDD